MTAPRREHLLPGMAARPGVDFLVERPSGDGLPEVIRILDDDDANNVPIYISSDEEDSGIEVGIAQVGMGYAFGLPRGPSADEEDSDEEDSEEEDLQPKEEEDSEEEDLQPEEEEDLQPEEEEDLQPEEEEDSEEEDLQPEEEEDLQPEEEEDLQLEEYEYDEETDEETEDEDEELSFYDSGYDTMTEEEEEEDEEEEEVEVEEEEENEEEEEEADDDQQLQPEGFWQDWGVPVAACVPVPDPQPHASGFQEPEDPEDPEEPEDPEDPEEPVPSPSGLSSSTKRNLEDNQEEGTAKPLNWWSQWLSPCTMTKEALAAACRAYNIWDGPFGSRGESPPSFPVPPIFASRFHEPKEPKDPEEPVPSTSSLSSSMKRNLEDNQEEGTAKRPRLLWEGPFGAHLENPPPFPAPQLHASGFQEPEEPVPSTSGLSSSTKRNLEDNQEEGTAKRPRLWWGDPLILWPRDDSDSD